MVLRKTFSVVESGALKQAGWHLSRSSPPAAVRRNAPAVSGWPSIAELRNLTSALYNAGFSNHRGAFWSRALRRIFEPEQCLLVDLSTYDVLRSCIATYGATGWQPFRLARSWASAGGDFRERPSWPAARYEQYRHGISEEFRCTQGAMMGMAMCRIIRGSRASLNGLMFLLSTLVWLSVSSNRNNILHAIGKLGFATHGYGRPR